MKTRLVLARAMKCIFAAGVLIGLSIAQSTVVVSDIRFEGELGVPVSELQEYTQFLKGHTLEKAKVLEQSSRASMGALQRRGFWKAQVVPSIPAAPDSGSARKGDMLLVKVHAGQQYRIKEVSFSGLASEFSAGELREAFHLRQGDVADGNEIGTGMANLLAIFKKKGLNYFAIPAMTFDDTAHTMALNLDIEK